MPDQIRPNFIYFSKFLFNLKTANELLISLEKKILKKKKKKIRELRDFFFLNYTDCSIKTHNYPKRQ